jgi:hypothetical protein
LKAALGRLFVLGRPLHLVEAAARQLLMLQCSARRRERRANR